MHASIAALPIHVGCGNARAGLLDDLIGNG